MTFSSKFSALDNREAALLDDFRPDQREIFEQICAGYEADFRPETDLERDTVYCLATLRRRTDRIRAAAFNRPRSLRTNHGYVPPKFRTGLEELAAYEHRTPGPLRLLLLPGAPNPTPEGRLDLSFLSRVLLTSFHHAEVAGLLV